MENKTLKRIVRKSLDISDESELASVLPGLAPEPLENLKLTLENIDKAFIDFERVIDIRDRSLAISSKELSHLNDEITAQAQRQKSVLDQLKGLLTLLSGSSRSEGQDDMTALIVDVEQLVRNQMQAGQNLKLLAEEGLKISSTLSFRALEAQVQSSIRTFTQYEVDVQFYFSGQLLQTEDPIAYYRCNANNEVGERLDPNHQPSDGAQYLNISSAKGHGTLAIARVDFPKQAEDASARMLIIEPLLPSIGATLENIRLLQEEKRKQHLENELQTARFVQQTLLPPASIRETKELDVNGYYQSASECGGDWWTYFRLADGRYVVIVGDVTGHGTASAMVCAVVKGYCDSFYSRPNLNVSDVLAELNQVVYRMSRDGKRAMTMAVATIDLEKHELTFGNAGHPHPLVVNFNPAPTTTYLINSGNILGLDAKTEYQAKKFPFKPGDHLVLYTDGVTECMDRSKEMYGERRLRSALKKAQVQSAADLNRSLVQDLKTFYGNEAPGDDITTVVVRYSL